jgi:thiol-disulfide isomerase/thioredoxin
MPWNVPLSRRNALVTIALGFSIPAIAFALDGREPAPRFRAKTMAGETITNGSIEGKVVLVQFWATWCPYCKSDTPALEKLGLEFENQGLMVLGVNVGESKKKVKQFLEQSPRSSKMILMEDTNLAAVFEAKRFPLYVLIDRSGKLAGTQEGAGGEGALRRLLRKAALDSQDSASDGVELRSSPRRQ